MVQKFWINSIYIETLRYSLDSCSNDDDDKDIVEQVIFYVSPETGT